MANVPQYGFSNAFNNSVPTAFNFSAPTSSEPAPQTSNGGGGTYRNDLGEGWNPFQYATDQRTNELAKIFGGTPGRTASTAGTGSPFAIPQQNVIDFGGGYVGNAGLTQQLIDFGGGDMDLARRRLAAMAKIENGQNLGLGNHPALEGYDPARTTPVTAANTNQFTGNSILSNIQRGSQGGNPFAAGNAPASQAPTQSQSAQFNPLMLMALMGQMNPSSSMGGGGYSGVAQLLNLIRSLRPQTQSLAQLPTYSSTQPNRALLYPTFY